MQGGVMDFCHVCAVTLNAGFDFTTGSSGDDGLGSSMQGGVMDFCHVCAITLNAGFDLTTGSSGDDSLGGSMWGGVTPLCGGQYPTFIYKKCNKISYIW